MVDRIAREVFGLVFESRRDGMVVVDRATRHIVSANVRAAEMLHRDIDSLIGATLAELAIDVDRDLASPGHYEDIALQGGHGHPVHVELDVSHVRTADFSELAVLAARDTPDRSLARAQLGEHTTLHTAHADLRVAHAELGDAKRKLEARNQQIALVAWRAAMGELVARIAHHLNNPLGALASTLHRISGVIAAFPPDQRGELERLFGRVAALTHRIESNVAAIVQASRSSAAADEPGDEIPPELAAALSAFAAKLEHISMKVQP